MPVKPETAQSLSQLYRCSWGHARGVNWAIGKSLQHSYLESLSDFYTLVTPTGDRHWHALSIFSRYIKKTLSPGRNVSFSHFGQYPGHSTQYSRVCFEHLERFKLCNKVHVNNVLIHALCYKEINLTQQ